MQALWGNSLLITRPTVHCPWNIKRRVTFCPQVSLAGRKAEAVELEGSCGGGMGRNKERGGREESSYILMRCGFGGFSESICLVVLATCRQLVDACQSSQHNVVLSLLTWQSQERREEERGEMAEGTFLTLCVLDEERLKMNNKITQRRMKLQLVLPFKIDIFVYFFSVYLFIYLFYPLLPPSSQVHLNRVIDMERQMAVKEREKGKWQVLMSKDRRRWQLPVHSNPLFLSFLHPPCLSVTVNLKTWIWWWYLVTTAVLNSRLWYFLPGSYVGFYADQPAEVLLFSVFLSAKSVAGTFFLNYSVHKRIRKRGKMLYNYNYHFFLYDLHGNLFFLSFPDKQWIQNVGSPAQIALSIMWNYGLLPDLSKIRSYFSQLGHYY